MRRNTSGVVKSSTGLRVARAEKAFGRCERWRDYKTSSAPASTALQRETSLTCSSVSSAPAQKFLCVACLHLCLCVLLLRLFCTLSSLRCTCLFSSPLPNTELLEFAPEDRITPADALKHQFFEMDLAAEDNVMPNVMPITAQPTSPRANHSRSAHSGAGVSIASVAPVVS